MFWNKKESEVTDPYPYKFSVGKGEIKIITDTEEYHVSVVGYYESGEVVTAREIYEKLLDSSIDNIRVTKDLAIFKKMIERIEFREWPHERKYDTYRAEFPEMSWNMYHTVRRIS